MGGATRVAGRAFAERIAAALGEGWIVETRQAAWEGTVPHAAVRRGAVGGDGQDGPLRLLLEDLGIFVAVTLLPFDKGRYWQFRGAAEVDEHAPAIAAAVAAVAAVAAGATNVADAAWRITAALETMLPLQDGVWDFSITSVAYPPVYGSVNLLSGDDWQGIVTAAPRPDGVLIEVPGTDLSLPAATPAEVCAHLPAIARAVLVRFEQRRRHHQAVLRVKAAAGAVVDALRRDVPPPRGRWGVQMYNSFGSPPAAYVMARGGDDYAETFVTLDEVGEPDGRSLRLQTRDIDDRRDRAIERTIAPGGDLAPAVAEAVTAVHWWTGRLSASRMVPSRAYRLLRPLADLPAGAEIVFAGREYIPKEGWTRYTFTVPGGRDLLLDEGYDAHVAVLRDLDLYLRCSIGT